MIKIVIPMAGEGKRFQEQGHTFPKPLIEIKGRAMIEWVVENITPKEPHQFVFLCKQEHVERFALDDVLKLIAPGCTIITMQKPTAGALCSVLLASEIIDKPEELLIANADQVLDFSIDEFLATCRRDGTEGCILTFPSRHPKWSFAKVLNGEVVAVAEKRPISDVATSGLYYFRSGAEFVSAAEAMLLKNAALSGEFYVCPVYNEMILRGCRITTHHLRREQMFSLATPEDVAEFLSSATLPLTA